ncbi:MAG: hypothetical protein RIC56_23035 [Pseudomonadales bacterium]
MKHGRTPHRRDRLHGLWRWLVGGALAAMGQFSIANPEYLELWGPGVGTPAPLLAADDQEGNRQTLQTLAGPKGLLLVFSRSVDW